MLPLNLGKLKGEQKGSLTLQGAVDPPQPLDMKPSKGTLRAIRTKSLTTLMTPRLVLIKKEYKLTEELPLDLNLQEGEAAQPISELEMNIYEIILKVLYPVGNVLLVQTLITLLNYRILADITIQFGHKTIAFRAVI
jgi:hypothetical protein